GLRFAIAAVVMGIFAALKGVRIPDTADLPRILALGAIGIALYCVALNLGVHTIPAAPAGFLLNTVTVFTAVIASVALRERLTAPLAATAAAVYLGVFPAAVGYAAYTYALTILPAARATVFLYLVPVASVPIAWVWLGETPSPLTLCGGALVICGVAWSRTRG